MFVLRRLRRAALCQALLRPVRNRSTLVQEEMLKEAAVPDRFCLPEDLVKPSIPARSWIFSAKSRAGFKKAMSVGADVIVLDLEDSVPKEAKSRMRHEYLNALREGLFAKKMIYVRANEVSDLDELRKDVDLMTSVGVAGFMLAKTETISDIRTIEELVSEAESKRGLSKGFTKLVPIIETPRAFFRVHELTLASPRISAVVVGSGDFMAQQLCDEHSLAYDTLFATVALAARAAGIEAFAGVHDKLDDYRGFEHFCYKLKSSGYTGAVGLTPKQIALANRIFSYSPEELQWAQKVLQHSNGSIRTVQRSIQESRQMIGPPHLRRAKAILERSKVMPTLEKTKSSPVVDFTKPQQPFTRQLRVGETTFSPVEVTVTDSWKVLWDGVFLSSPGGISNSNVMCNKVGLPSVPIPFSLLATAVAGFTVSVFSYEARVHLGFYDMFQSLPVFSGDTLRAVFRINDVCNTMGKDGNPYVIASSTHALLNQRNQIVFSTTKKTMFSPVSIGQGHLQTNNPSSSTLNPGKSTWRLNILSQPSNKLVSRPHQPDLIPGQLHAHSFPTVISYGEMRMLATLLHITNPHHHNVHRYNPSDILVPGPFVMAAAMANTSPDIGDIVYEDIKCCTNINKVNPGDQINTITYVMDSKPLQENPALEEVTLKHLAIKNTEVDHLLHDGIPKKLLSGELQKPSEYEDVCLEQCPLLFHRIACQMVRRIVRIRPTATVDMPTADNVQL